MLLRPISGHSVVMAATLALVAAVDNSDTGGRAASLMSARGGGGGLDGVDALTAAAVDRQTAAIAAAIRKLCSSVVAAKTSAASSSPLSSAMLTAVLNGLHDLGLTRDRAGRALDGVAQLEDRVVALEAEGRALRKDVRRLKKESKRLSAESARTRRDLNSEVLKLNVYFDAVRETEFGSAGNLSYDFCSANRGGGLDPGTGVFTAPMSGDYLFSFHANTMKGSDGLVLLRRNGEVLAGAFDTDNFKHNSLAQTAVSALRVGDRVWVEILSGGVRSNHNLYVHFVGVLIGPEEGRSQEEEEEQDNRV